MGKNQTKIIRLARALTLCFLAGWLACSRHQDEQPRATRPALEYTLTIPALPQDSLHVTIEVNSWTAGDSVRFVLPPMYADNPFLTASRRNLHNLTVFDKNNARLTCAADSMRVGAYRSAVIAFSAYSLPARIEYDITFYYMPDRAYIPVPYARADRGFLEGNYLFAIPCRNRNITLPELWRDPFDIELNYNPGSGISIHGDPAGGVRFRNSYELLFSQSVVNGVTLVEGTGGHQLFRVVDVRSSSPVAAALLPVVRAAGTILLKDITALFGTLGAPLTMILGTDLGGGMEGMYAFSLLDPWVEDAGGVFNMVLAHEMIHAWVGVRCGEYDDPWWKEGTTNYLGFVVAKRNGLCTQALAEGALLADLSETLAVQHHSLSSAYAREELFRSPGVGALVYTKGAQVSMLLDRRIREASRNTQSLDKITADLCKVYDGRAFRRTDYLAFIQSHAGVDVSEIFGLYVDAAGVIPQSVLQEAYRDLVARGAWGAVGLAKRGETGAVMPERVRKY